MDLLPKHELKQKGQEAFLDGAVTRFHVKIQWKTSVDLDLHAILELKPDATMTAKTGGFLGIGGRSTTIPVSKTDHHVSFRNKGSLTSEPFVSLDKDAGVGDKGGDNEENLTFEKLEAVKYALIVANIYNKPNSNFASYDGKVTIITNKGNIIVPLSESKPGSWFVVAMLDNSSPIGAKIININEVLKEQPRLSSFIR